MCMRSVDLFAYYETRSIHSILSALAVSLWNNFIFKRSIKNNYVVIALLQAYASRNETHTMVRYVATQEGTLAVAYTKDRVASTEVEIRTVEDSSFYIHVRYIQVRTGPKKFLQINCYAHVC